MYHALTGAGFLPLILAIALLVPIAYHDLAGRHSGLAEDPRETYRRIWHRIRR